MTLSPVLVPHDGSRWSAAAASFARVLAKKDALRTTLVHVLSGAGASERSPAAAAAAAHLLAAEADRFVTPVESVVLDGDPVEALVAEAEHLDAGLVVMGTRGRSPLSGLLLGSTSRGLLRACPRPLVVVHEPVDFVRRILVGVDGSERGLAVARTAATVAGALGADVVLVNVVDADPKVAADPQAVGIPPQAWRASLEARRERVFGPVRGQFGGRAREVLAFGIPVEGLRRAAREEGADLVVVGRVGTSGLSADAWLSVAYALAIQGPFATLVV